MFCRKCGFALPDDAVFCQKCGCRTDAAAAPVTPAAEPPAAAPVPPVAEPPAAAPVPPAAEPPAAAPVPAGSEMPVSSVPTPIPAVVTPPKKKHRALTVVLAIVLTVVVVIGGLAIAILPRPDLEMDDFKEETPLSAIFRYGIPTGRDGDAYYSYNYTDITFYGVPVDLLEYDFAEETITMRFYGSDEAEDAAEAVIDHCEYRPSYAGYISTMVYDFSYGELDITVIDYDSMLSITIEW